MFRAKHLNGKSSLFHGKKKKKTKTKLKRKKKATTSSQRELNVEDAEELRLIREEAKAVLQMERARGQVSKRALDPEEHSIDVKSCVRVVDADEVRVAKAIVRDELKNHADFVVHDTEEAEAAYLAGDPDEESDWVFSSDEEGEGAGENEGGDGDSAPTKDSNDAPPATRRIRTRGMLFSPDRVSDEATVHRATQAVDAILTSYSQAVTPAVLIVGTDTTAGAKFQDVSNKALDDALSVVLDIRMGTQDPPPHAVCAGWQAFKDGVFAGGRIVHEVPMAHGDGAPAPPRDSICRLSGLRMAHGTEYTHTTLASALDDPGPARPPMLTAQPVLGLEVAAAAFSKFIRNPTVPRPGQGKKEAFAIAKARVQKFMACMVTLRKAIHAVLFATPVSGLDRPVDPPKKRKKQKKKRKRKPQREKEQEEEDAEQAQQVHKHQRVTE